MAVSLLLWVTSTSCYRHWNNVTSLTSECLLSLCSCDSATPTPGPHPPVLVPGQQPVPLVLLLLLCTSPEAPRLRGVSSAGDGHAHISVFEAGGVIGCWIVALVGRGVVVLAVSVVEGAVHSAGPASVHSQSVSRVSVQRSHAEDSFTMGEDVWILALPQDCFHTTYHSCIFAVGVLSRIIPAINEPVF